jgi:hypothetical protein
MAWIADIPGHHQLLDRTLTADLRLEAMQRSDLWLIAGMSGATNFVIPAKAGIQSNIRRIGVLDTGLRRYDGACL